ncbi:Protein of unknown function (DUF3105) [Nesidiocoris tenuis]|uniref:DUF3105 domain-containing protein n=1 Tax=Nesidiocoris tenuis TaxID=355587 RepID=A0ABN7B292_9HEMI|nr:Protein of unknown function (DUF3105) [Nesidiocoris tenuis]
MWTLAFTPLCLAFVFCLAETDGFNLGSLPKFWGQRFPDDVPVNPEWKGRWFPDKPTPRPSTEKTAGEGSPDYLIDDFNNEMSNHLSEMISMDNRFCDDGKQNLTLDFPSDESHYICTTGKRYIEPKYEMEPMLTKYPIPAAFVPSHRCMNETLSYPFRIPTFGPHRPVWAKWGEYDYLPPQRWVHNLEHGGIVMLYNPCAHRFLVQQLREVVRNCLYKHIITPYHLDEDRPLAVLAWGYSLTMAEPDRTAVVDFIQSRANRGPEMIDSDGKYDLYLKSPASSYSQLGGGICTHV